MWERLQTHAADLQMHLFQTNIASHGPSDDISQPPSDALNDELGLTMSIGKDPDENVGEEISDGLGACSLSRISATSSSSAASSS